VVQDQVAEDESVRGGVESRKCDREIQRMRSVPLVAETADLRGDNATVLAIATAT